MTNPITVNSPGLLYSCYAGSGIGNAAGPLANSGQDVNHTFAIQSAGTVYSAFLLNLTSVNTTGDYFFHLFDGPTTGTTFRAKVFAKKDPASANYAIGVSFSANAGTPSTGFTFVPGTTYLVVTKYTINAGAANDQVALFINPVPGAAEPAPTLTATDASNDAAAVALQAVAIRQGASPNGPIVQVDGIRVADSWADAVTAAGPYSITSVGAPGGTITPIGVTSVACGGSQTYTIAPSDKCHTINDVVVDGISQGAITTYTFSNVQANHTITATFNTLGPFTINATSGPNGSIAPSGPTSVACGANQTFNFTPDPGYQVSDVQVDGSSVGAPSSYTFTDVQTNHTINVDFAPIPLVTPTVTLTSDVNPSTCGQAVNFTATISPSAATGTVEFFDGASSIGSAPVVSGSATVSTSTLAGGHHTMTAQYSGDGSYTPATSNVLVQNVHCIGTTNTTVVTPCNTQGWAPANVTGGGTVAINSALPRDNTGSLEFQTVGSSSKADFVRAESGQRPAQHAEPRCRSSSTASRAARAPGPSGAGGAAVRRQRAGDRPLLVSDLGAGLQRLPGVPDRYLDSRTICSKATSGSAPSRRRRRTRTIDIYNRTLADWLQPGTVTDGEVTSRTRSVRTRAFWRTRSGSAPAGRGRSPARPTTS